MAKIKTLDINELVTLNLGLIEGTEHELEVYEECTEVYEYKTVLVDGKEVQERTDTVTHFRMSFQLRADKTVESNRAVFTVKFPLEGGKQPGEVGDNVTVEYDTEKSRLWLNREGYGSIDISLWGIACHLVE